MLNPSRLKKHTTIDFLSSLSNENSFIFVIRFLDLNSSAIEKLRSDLRNTGSKMYVAKNSLVKLFLSKTTFGDVSGDLKLQTAIVFTNDDLSTSKILFNLHSQGKISCMSYTEKSGSIGDTNKIEIMSKIPSLDEMKSIFIGVLNSSASSFCACCTSHVRSLESGN